MITTTSLGWALYAEAEAAGVEIRMKMRTITTNGRKHRHSAARGENLIAKVVYTGGRSGES
jgi:hypothetical protein